MFNILYRTLYFSMHNVMMVTKMTILYVHGLRIIKNNWFIFIFSELFFGCENIPAFPTIMSKCPYVFYCCHCNDTRKENRPYIIEYTHTKTASIPCKVVSPNISPLCAESSMWRPCCGASWDKCPREACRAWATIGLTEDGSTTGRK